MKFIFIMQHAPTSEQVAAAKAAGATTIVALAPSNPSAPRVEGVEYSSGTVGQLIVPDEPSLGRDWFVQRAAEVVSGLGVEAGDVVQAMGQQQLAAAINAAARAAGASLVESVTARESVDEPQADGSIKKVAVFKFRGFRPVYEF